MYGTKGSAAAMARVRQSSDYSAAIGANVFSTRSLPSVRFLILTTFSVIFSSNPDNLGHAAMPQTASLAPIS